MYVSYPCQISMSSWTLEAEPFKNTGTPPCACHLPGSTRVRQAYAAHPEHVKVINDLIKPIMEPGTRAAIQYER